jgi:hypothetical protein
MSRSLRGLSQEGVREALSRNPRLRWVAKTVLRPLIDRLLPQISAAQNENLLPKVEPILFHYMMVNLTATLSGFGTEMKVISNLSPGDSPSRRNLLTPFSDSQRSSAISTTAICSCLRLARFEIVSSRHSPRMIDNRRVGGLRLMRPPLECGSEPGFSLGAQRGTGMLPLALGIPPLQHCPGVRYDACSHSGRIIE